MYRVRPLGLAGSLAIFAVPTAVFFLVLHVSIPALDRLGLPLAVNFALQAPIPFLTMIAIALLGYRAEGGHWRWAEFATRFRLTRPGVVDVAAGIALGAVFLASYHALQFTVGWMVEWLPWPGLPDWLLRYRGEGRLLDVPMAGNPWLLLIPLTVYLFNVFGEELLWRGYVLPRQQLAFGAWAWLVHGLLWNLFHFGALYIEMLAILPGCLLLAWVSVWRRNTWTPIIAHLILNGWGVTTVARALWLA